MRDQSSGVGEQSIASAIISLGKTLGMPVVAEGVETAAQADYLRSQGCTERQGFFYSRAVSAASISGMVELHPSPELPGSDVPAGSPGSLNTDVVGFT